MKIWNFKMHLRSTFFYENIFFGSTGDCPTYVDLVTGLYFFSMNIERWQSSYLHVFLKFNYI